MTLKHNTTKHSKLSVYLNIKWSSSPLLPSLTSHFSVILNSWFISAHQDQERGRGAVPGGS